VVGACTVVIPRVLAITLALSPAVAEQLVPYLVAPTVVGGGFVAYALLRGRPGAGRSEEPDPSPLRLLSAIKMVLAFQLVLLAVPAVQHLWGAAGVLGSAAVLGLTDMDALTYSMARLGGTGTASLAGRAIAVGILSNTILKLALVLGLGSPGLRRAAAPGLLALAAAVVAGLWIGS
jgi:uncharacterized membrane protein (DUF4010 family)